MSKSKQFVLDRIDQLEITLAKGTNDKIESTEVNEIPFWDAVKRYVSIGESLLESSLEGNLLSVDLKSEAGEWVCRIKYDPDADFEYCATEHSTHDGTMLFTVDMLTRLLNRVITSGTYNSKTAPDDYTTNPCGYDVNYTVGDVVVRSDFGFVDINGRAMAGQHDIACLPISVEYIKIS